MHSLRSSLLTKVSRLTLEKRCVSTLSLLNRSSLTLNQSNELRANSFSSSSVNVTSPSPASPSSPPPTSSRKGQTRNSATMESSLRSRTRDEHLSSRKHKEQDSESTATPPPPIDDEKTKEAPPKRRKQSEIHISEVLKAKHTLRWVEPVIPQSATVNEAILVCIDRGLSGMMVVDQHQKTHDLSHSRGKVVGMTTSRDLLRIIAAGVKRGLSADDILNQKVGNFMTPISQVIYARPDETIGTCRTLMAKLGVKCLPILAGGRVEGIITARDMADYGLHAKDRGGKANYLKDISERVGLGKDTSMAEPPHYLVSQLALQQKPLYMNLAIAELPHPFKTADGCGMNKRDFGPQEFSTDPDLSEDAHFVTRARFLTESDLSEVVYMGVADGVGSWREYGVDPRDFSHKLMEECYNIVVEASQKNRKKVKEDSYSQIITPPTILAKAYERVKKQNIIGSSTACIAMFDSVHHQLHFSNLGDSGVIVLRHIDSEVAGSLKRDRINTRMERKSDLRVAFVSQQQLLQFNHPYQLGWTGEEHENDKTSFKNPSDCCTSSIHVRRGDIVIMATDGLFDNVDIDDIAAIALEWEQKTGFIRHGDVIAREKRWEMGGSMTNVSLEAIPLLSQKMCEKARENSLDNSVDSPFAILAKENDIMWSGGMPDDCTVIAMHVVGRAPTVTEI